MPPISSDADGYGITVLPSESEPETQSEQSKGVQHGSQTETPIWLRGKSVKTDKITREVDSALVDRIV